MKKTFTKALLSFVLVCTIGIAAKAQITAAQSGNWSATATWTGGVVPTATDNVEIGGTYTVTVDGVDSCTTLILGDGTNSGSLVFNAGDSLSLSGALTIGNGTGTGNIDMTNGGTLNLTSFTAPTAGIWKHGIGTVSYNLTGSSIAYVIPNSFFATYNNLIVKAAPTCILRSAGALHIINSFVVPVGSSFDLNQYGIAAGDIQGAGTITNLSTSATLSEGSDNTNSGFTGTIAGAIALNKIGAGTLTLSGTNTYTDGTTLNSGQLTINSSTAIGAGTFTINGGTIDDTLGVITLSNNNPQIWNGSFAFKGTKSLNMGTGPVTLGGSYTITLSGTGNLVEGGTINDNTNSLYINGTGTLSFNGQAIQLDNLGILTGNLYTYDATLSLAGNFTNNGVFNDGTGVEIFNGTSAQSIGGSIHTAFNNLTLNNSAGLSLNQSVSVSNQLTLTSGLFSLGADSLTLGGSASITGAGASSYIVTNGSGTLNKVYASANTFNFPIGDNLSAGNYTPLSLSIFSGNFPSVINVLVSPSKDPHNNSALNYLNRYWNVTQNGLGIFSASLIATYLPSDIVGTEGSIASGLWPGTFPWSKFSQVNTTTHLINETVSQLGDISGITLAAPTVNITPTTVCASTNTITAITTGDDPTLSYSWSTGQTTSAANPTTSGTYTLTVTDGNGFTASENQFITVVIPTVALSSATGTDGQSVCINNPINDVTYAIGGGTTGATVSALPPGVVSSFSSGTLTISGTPTAGGVYTYTVTTTGGSCAPAATASGTIVANAPDITLTSSIGTDAQSACLNNAITNITYNIGGSATNAIVSGLPSGINSSFSGGVLTMSGTPTLSGVSSYTVSTSGGSCGTTTATGSISVGSLSLALTSSVGSDAQTVCYNTSIANITYAAGGSATSATVTGLPNGVNFSFSSGTISISGKPASGGIYTYTVTAIGGECSPQASGTITVNAPTATLVSQAGTDNQLICQGSQVQTVRYFINSTATGATVTGLPNGLTYLYNNDTLTISGIPTDSGTFSYTVFTSGSPCGVGTATGILQISSPSATLSSAVGTDAQAVCVNSTIVNITYNIGGTATGATVSGLPTGVGFAYNSGLLTISGTPSFGGSYSYTVTTTGGLCNPATASGNLTVNAPVITLASASGTDNQAVCANSPIVPIIYAYGGTTIGTSISGLPTGLSTASINDTLVISGTPTDTGSFTYTINTIGASCGSIMVTGTITINSPAISLSSGTNTDNQTLCGNTQMQNITYNVSGGATGASVAGLPPGVNFSYVGGSLTISGAPTGSGTFSYTVTTSGGGCGAALANGNINVNLSPNVTIKGVAGLRAGTNDTLVASGAASYIWLNDGNLNDSDIVKPIKNTTYTVVGTTAQGCRDTTTFFVTINTVGVNEVSAPTTISLYPNPAIDVLNLSFDVVGVEKAAQIKLIDITGKVIETIQSTINNGKVITLDINTLAQGMYFVKVVTANNSEVLRFMKQ